MNVFCRHIARVHRKRSIILLTTTSLRHLFTMKLESPEFKSVLTEEVKILEKLFLDNNFEIRIAGGAVRDLLAGIQPKDLDFATTATPQEMKDIFNKNEVRMINMAGEKHGTITPRINDKENFEVTTLRVDVVTDGRRAEVAFVKDWQLDANRRDLTINSMFLGLDGTLYDYFNGHEDLKNRRVVFVGDAATRIQEDYLRILRYFRFYGRIAIDNNQHDEATLKAIEINRQGLDQVSGERIWAELYKTLEGNFGAELLRLMIKLQIGPHIGIKCEPNLKQFDELNGRLQKSGLKVRAITLVCGLLNSTEEFLQFHQRCKLSNVDRDLGLFILSHRHEKPHENPIKPYQMLVMTSSNKPSDVQLHVEEVLKYLGKTELLASFREWKLPKFPINGNMIRANIETTSGRQIGFLLNALKELWAEKDFKLSEEELIKELPTLASTPQKKKLKT